MKKDIIHIYHGTQGAGGLYIHEIYLELKSKGFNQETFLSYYYPFKYGKRIFFKYTDLASGVKKSKLRIYLRGVELIVGLLYSYFYIIINRPKIVNYSLISSYISDYVFLKLIKTTSNSKIIVTCHDVIPFGESKNSILKQISIRKKILKYADYFLVHNENSIKDLEEVFNISCDKIFYHPFPLMDLNKINTNQNLNIQKDYDFAFLGHLRDSKGVDLLLDAWKMLHQKFPHAKLLLAGNLPDGSKLKLDNLEAQNIYTNIKYLSDDDYFGFLNKSRNIILPYRSGTNSGVLYNLLTMNVDIIYSDILMFANNPLLNEKGKFRAGDVYSLYEKLCEYYSSKIPRENYKLDEYKEKFSESVIDVYRNILNIKM